MKSIRQLGLLAAALLLAGCQEAGTPQIKLQQCEAALDSAVTVALRERAVQLEAQYQTIWDQTQAAGGTNKSPRDAIAVSNVALRHGEVGGESIFADPLAGSMTLAAQRSWKNGNLVLPHSPSVVVDGDQLTDWEAETISAAYGWQVEASRTDGYLVGCTYTRQVGLNPWRNSSLWAPFNRAWRSFFLGEGDIRVNATVSPEGFAVRANFVGQTEAVDTALLRMMDKSYNGSVYFPFSLVGTVKSLERARELRRDEDEKLARMGASARYTFWFEGKSR